MNKLKTQLQKYGNSLVGSWTRLFGECILAITNNSDAVKRTDKYKPKFIAELQYSNIDDFLNKLTKNEFVVLFAETLSTILQPVQRIKTDEERKEREKRDEIFRINQNAARDLENGGHQISYRRDFTLGGSLRKKTPRRRKYSKRNNTRRKRTARKRRSYK